MPYQIPAGVVYNLYLLIDTGLRNLVHYNAKPTATVHDIFYKELNPIPTPALIR
jgi:hypothetical protein